MQADMDKLIFESRREIEEVITALENVPAKYQTNTVKNMIDKLEVIHMSW